MCPHALQHNIARISSTFVFMFILFGAFLLCSGAGDFVIHLTTAGLLLAVWYYTAFRNDNHQTQTS
jgi:TRAP-type uncharacterized transport system fused permease subunit